LKTRCPIIPGRFFGDGPERIPRGLGEVTHVVVSGVPGSGKSTLARSLAECLGLPILAVDPVKEALWDELGGGDVERSRALGRAANEVLLSVAAIAPPSVLDSFWRHEWAVDRLRALPVEIIEVFCDCPAPQARLRYRDRQRHPAHLDWIRVHDPDPWTDHRARPLFDDSLAVETTAPVSINELTADLTADPRWDGTTGVSRSMLVVVSGLPGTGKSAIAGALSEATGAPVLGRDLIGAALSRAGVTAAGDPDGVAFDLLGVLAGEQLRVGGAAILDSVGGRDSTRAQWRALAAAHDVPLLVIECVCSDVRIHRERLEGRRRGIPDWYELTWAHVEEARTRYVPWEGQRLMLDATEPLETNIAAALRYVSAASRDTERFEPGSPCQP
jgi:predicted kinase